MNDFIHDIKPIGFRELPIIGVQCQYRVNAYEPTNFALLNIHYAEFLKKTVHKRQAEYLAGRFCAATALKSLIKPPLPSIGTGKHREPLWPKGFVGSITHSGSTAAAVVGFSEKIYGLGIDVENPIDLDAYDGIMRQVLTAEEHRLFQNLAEEKYLMLAVCFAIKEAFFKAVFPKVGDYFYFDAVAVTSLPERKTESVIIELKKNLNSQLKAGMRFEAKVNLSRNNEIMVLIIITQEQMNCTQNDNQ